MPKLFISYRRSASSGHAGRLYDRLIPEYGEDNVFLDVEQIPPGETFSTYLLSKIDACDVFLLMLGDGTLDRCKDPEDWVRREIAYALQRPEIIFIPVLQDGFKMPPPHTLPGDIRDITMKNASFLFHQMFDESVHKLIESINEIHPLPTFDAPDGDTIPIQVRDTDSKPPSASSAQTGTGKVKIHRVGNMVVYRIRPFTLKLDGEEIGQISNNETLELDVPVGHHTLSVHVDLHNPSQQIHIKEGDLLEFEIAVRNMGMTLAFERV